MCIWIQGFSSHGVAYVQILISATAKDETKFVEEAVHQLLKARRVLKCSYVYGYYLDGPQYRKLVFEFMQVRKELVKVPIL